MKKYRNLLKENLYIINKLTLIFKIISQCDVFYDLYFRCVGGTQVTFVFNFGDENSETVEGMMDLFLNLMSGETSHRYTQG